MTNKRGPGFHHVAIRVFDFDATLKFYTEGLGFPRRYGWGEGDKRAAMLDMGDGNYLEVFAGGKAPVAEQTSPIEHFAIRVPDVDAAYSKAMAAGATSHMEPKTLDLNGDYSVPVKIAFVRGLDGELFEFFENDEL